VKEAAALESTYRQAPPRNDKPLASGEDEGFALSLIKSVRRSPGAAEGSSTRRYEPMALQSSVLLELD